MRDYTLSQQYALIGFDGQDCLHMTTAKRAVLRAVEAARLLEGLLFDYTAQDQGTEEKRTADQETFEKKLAAGFTKIVKQSKKEARELEKQITHLLEVDGVLEKAPDLLGSDMYYYTAGVSMKTYRCDQEQYLAITESIRAEALEEGPMTLESFCLLWLFRESGCIHDLFSVEEQNTLISHINGLAASDDIYRSIWQAEFHSGMENLVGSFLKEKSKLFKNPYLEGINLMFPFLDRRQAIFVDYVILGSDVKSRRLAMLTFLTERGHYVEEVKSGEETFLKIDNAYYRVFPKTISCFKFPIQGLMLLPVYR